MPRRRLREIINLKHPLCQLADQIEWSVFEDKLGQFYSENQGAPVKPIRLMVGLHYLKYIYDYIELLRKADLDRVNVDTTVQKKKQNRYRHANQHKRARAQVRKLKTYLGRLVRDIKHKAEHADGVSAIDTELEELWGVLARAVGRGVGMPAGDAAGLPGLGAIYGVITATTLIWLLRKKPQGDDESLV